MAKRIKFDYNGEKYEGIAHYTNTTFKDGGEEDKKRLILTDAAVTTADGQNVTYRTPLMVDMAKMRDIKVIEEVEVKEPWYCV